MMAYLPAFPLLCVGSPLPKVAQGDGCFLVLIHFLSCLGHSALLPMLTMMM